MSAITSNCEVKITPPGSPSILGKRDSSSIDFDAYIPKDNPQYTVSPLRCSKRFQRLRATFTPTQSGEIPVLNQGSPLQFSAKVLLSTLALLEKKSSPTCSVEVVLPKLCAKEELPKITCEQKGKEKSFIDHALENEKGNNLKRAEAQLLEKAQKNPKTKALFSLEEQLCKLIREEKIRKVKLEAGEEVISQRNALALEKNSKRLKFINRTRTFVGASVENQKNDQLRAFRHILSVVENSLNAGHLYYVQNEKKIMELKGIDPESCEEAKGVSISQVLDALLRSQWGKTIIKKHPAEARKTFALLLKIQNAEMKPRQLAANKFLKNHSQTLFNMASFIVDKQEHLIKANQGEFHDSSLVKLGLSWSCENDKDHLLDILEEQPDTLMIVNENRLIEPLKFLNKWEKRLQINLSAMKEGEVDPKVIVKHQMEAYKNKIKRCEKKMAASHIKQDELNRLKTKKTRLEKYYNQLSQAYRERDLLGQVTNVFGLEQAKLQLSNANSQTVLKKLIQQYLQIKLHESPGENRKLRGYLRQLNRLTSVDEGTLNYQELGKLLNKINTSCNSLDPTDIAY